jgi:hypothetical protein
VSAMAPIFRMVCTPAALSGAPQGWAAETMRDGELALLVDGGGLDAINAAAHALSLVTVSIVRQEEDPAEQAQTVIAFADSFPLVWISSGLTDAERTWARERRPMTLLIDAEGALPDAERGRIERFLALLARQTE